jgi:hypothetical protein
LVEKLPQSRRYRLCPQEYCICLVLLKLFEGIHTPLAAGLLQPYRADSKLKGQANPMRPPLFRRSDDLEELAKLVDAVGLLFSADHTARSGQENIALRQPALGRRTAKPRVYPGLAKITFRPEGARNMHVIRPGGSARIPAVPTGRPLQGSFRRGELTQDKPWAGLCFLGHFGPPIGHLQTVKPFDV